MEAGREKPSPFADSAIARAASLLALSPRASFVATILHAADSSKASLSALTKSWRPVESDTACVSSESSTPSIAELRHLPPDYAQQL